MTTQKRFGPNTTLLLQSHCETNQTYSSDKGHCFAPSSSQVDTSYVDLISFDDPYFEHLYLIESEIESQNICILSETQWYLAISSCLGISFAPLKPAFCLERTLKPTVSRFDQHFHHWRQKDKMLDYFNSHRLITAGFQPSFLNLLQKKLQFRNQPIYSWLFLRKIVELVRTLIPYNTDKRELNSKKLFFREIDAHEQVNTMQCIIFTYFQHWKFQWLLRFSRQEKSQITTRDEYCDSLDNVVNRNSHAFPNTVPCPISTPRDDVSRNIKTILRCFIPEACSKMQYFSRVNLAFFERARSILETRENPYPSYFTSQSLFLTQNGSLACDFCVPKPRKPTSLYFCSDCCFTLCFNCDEKYHDSKLLHNRKELYSIKDTHYSFLAAQVESGLYTVANDLDFEPDSTTDCISQTSSLMACSLFQALISTTTRQTVPPSKDELIVDKTLYQAMELDTRIFEETASQLPSYNYAFRRQASQISVARKDTSIVSESCLMLDELLLPYIAVFLEQPHFYTPCYTNKPNIATQANDAVLLPSPSCLCMHDHHGAKMDNKIHDDVTNHPCPYQWYCIFCKIPLCSICIPNHSHSRDNHVFHVIVVLSEDDRTVFPQPSHITHNSVSSMNVQNLGRVERHIHKQKKEATLVPKMRFNRGNALTSSGIFPFRSVYRQNILLTFALLQTVARGTLVFLYVCQIVAEERERRSLLVSKFIVSSLLSFLQSMEISLGLLALFYPECFDFPSKQEIYVVLETVFMTIGNILEYQRSFSIVVQNIKNELARYTSDIHHLIRISFAERKEKKDELKTQQGILTKLLYSEIYHELLGGCKEDASIALASLKSSSTFEGVLEIPSIQDTIAKVVSKRIISDFETLKGKTLLSCLNAYIMRPMSCTQLLSQLENITTTLDRDISTNFSFLSRESSSNDCLLKTVLKFDAFSNVFFTSLSIREKMANYLRYNASLNLTRTNSSWSVENDALEPGNYSFIEKWYSKCEFDTQGVFISLKNYVLSCAKSQFTKQNLVDINCILRFLLSSTELGILQ